MNNVTDFLAYRENKKKVEELLSTVDISKLGPAEQGQLIQRMGQLLKQQSDLLTAVLLDVGLLVKKLTNMEDQFMYVSGQAYLAIQTLKDKNICSAEEIEAAWDQIVKEKFTPQNDQAASEELNNVNLDTEDKPNESD